MSYIAFIVPSKEALPPGSPDTAPIERDAPFAERFFTISKSSVNKPPLQFPQWGSYVQPVGPAAGFRVGLFLVKLI
jgi:hypothetical protein